MSLSHAVEAFSKSPSVLVNKASTDNTASSLNLNKAITTHTEPLNENLRFVTLSEEGKRLSKQHNPERDLLDRISNYQGSKTIIHSQNTPLTYQKKIQNQPTPNTRESLTITDDEQKKIDQLKKRDLEVKNHERAHASIGGRYAGAPHYQYETGPNGTRYATDGEVAIDLTEVNNDPQATIDKMKQVYRAALAPREPSSADRGIASQAQQSITNARSDLSNIKDSQTEQSPLQPNSEANGHFNKQSRNIQTPQDIQNINAYRQANNISKNTLYQLA